jgi:hypothetical protein
MIPRCATEKLLDSEVVRRAGEQGYVLVRPRSGTGEEWYWQGVGTSFRPFFLSRREALYWMYAWLGHNGVFQ